MALLFVGGKNAGKPVNVFAVMYVGYFGAVHVKRVHRYAAGNVVPVAHDVFFGLAAETPLGAITFGPAIGDHDHRKIVFTLGRFF